MIDNGELARLEADLRGVPSQVNRNVNKAMRVTAGYIKDDWREGAEVGSGYNYATGYSRTIDYDMIYPGGAIEAEIGPVIGRKKSAGFLEEAPGGVRAAPQHAGRDALEANEGDFLRGIEIAVFEAMGGVMGK